MEEICKKLEKLFLFLCCLYFHCWGHLLKYQFSSCCSKNGVKFCLKSSGAVSCSLTSYHTAENNDKCRDMSMYANIKGFLTYQCIYDVYRQALFEVSQWCCDVDASLPEVSQWCCDDDTAV